MILLFLLLFVIIVITFAGDNFLASYSNGLYYIILDFFFFVIWSRAGYQNEITLVVDQGVRSFCNPYNIGLRSIFYLFFLRPGQEPGIRMRSPEM